jgi:hypothetical protein
LLPRLTVPLPLADERATPTAAVPKPRVAAR